MPRRRLKAGVGARGRMPTDRGQHNGVLVLAFLNHLDDHAFGNGDSECAFDCLLWAVEKLREELWILLGAFNDVIEQHLIAGHDYPD